MIMNIIFQRFLYIKLIKCFVFYKFLKSKSHIYIDIYFIV